MNKRKFASSMSKIITGALIFTLLGPNVKTKKGDLSKYQVKQEFGQAFERISKEGTYVGINGANIEKAKIYESYASALNSNDIETIEERSKRYESYFKRASEKTGLPELFLKAISFNESSVGEASENVMQLTPIAIEQIKETYNVKINPNDPGESIIGGALLLEHYKKELERKFKFTDDSLYAVLALSYRVGEPTVSKYLSKLGKKTIDIADAKKVEDMVAENVPYYSKKEKYPDKVMSLMLKGKVKFIYRGKDLIGVYVNDK